MFPLVDPLGNPLVLLPTSASLFLFPNDDNLIVKISKTYKIIIKMSNCPWGRFRGAQMLHMTLYYCVELDVNYAGP